MPPSSGQAPRRENQTMKVGLVGYQGSGKSAVFELLTGSAPDLSKSQTGQAGIAIVPDERFDRLVEHYQPKKVVPARIEMFDTPGLDRDRPENNAQRLGVIREAHLLVQVIGEFTGHSVIDDITSFGDDLTLADLQVVSNRIDRLKKDIQKPRPDREELQRELEAIEPIAKMLEDGQSLLDVEFTEAQEKVTRSFSLLTRKRRLIVINTTDADIDESLLSAVTDLDLAVLSAPLGLELEVQALSDEDRAEFAAEMGLGDPSRERLLRLIFDATDQITFYTSGEKEVHAWLLKRGRTVVEAAHEIHSDLARGFVRAEIWSSEDLLRLGSEREVKAAGLNHVEGKEYIVQDGDEIFIRSGV